MLTKLSVVIISQLYIYMYQNITFYNLNLHSVTYVRYTHNKAGEAGRQNY